MDIKAIKDSAERLLWMGETSVWDDVLHHGTFNNLEVVESAASKHNGEATLQEMSYTGSHINDVTKTMRCCVVISDLNTTTQLVLVVLSNSESASWGMFTFISLIDMQNIYLCIS
ncbi:hypothetical protein EYF80_029909 [Liparis tanakae]|uniref:Uncharacterized protein n=1 Tax=Liparis tanakae TaxID=230148 RepID=A0A4Z2H320_9TELE|nr:hypothetical protein EYF80_029909 [Liparis tanakae]